MMPVSAKASELPTTIAGMTATNKNKVKHAPKDRSQYRRTSNGSTQNVPTHRCGQKNQEIK